MPKQKKRDDSEQAPAILLWEIPFEFISSLPFDECALRLQDVNRNEGWRRTVFLSSIEPNKVLFHLPGRQVGLVQAWAVGDLKGLPENGTLIAGKVGMSPAVIFPLLIFCIGLVPIALRSVASFLFALIMAGFILSLCYVGMRGTLSNLLNTLKHTFEADGG